MVNLLKKPFLLVLSISCLSSLHAMEDSNNDSALNLALPNISRIAWTPKNAAKISALSFFVWSVVTFLSTEPHNKPVRYAWSEIKQGKNTLKNLKYLIIDGLIGHKAKRPSMRIYPGVEGGGKISAQLCEAYDDLKPSNQEGHVILRPGAYPKGIYGWTYEYIKPTLTALSFLALLSKDLRKATKGASQWGDWLAIDMSN